MRTRQPIFAALSAALLLAACGGGGSDTPDAAPPAPDGPPAPDAGPTCTAIALGTTDVVSEDPSLEIFQAPVTTDLGDGGPSSMVFAFRSGTNLQGTFDLTAGNQANLSTCNLCMLLETTDGQGNAVRDFFQDGGSVTLTEDPFTNGHMIGTATDVSLQEVTIDQNTGASSPVVGGACLSLGNLTLDHTKAPNAWTCAPDAYGDGTTCDCMCGAADTDCGNSANPVNGCALNQTCFVATCETPPANDTCQTALPLVIGTPITGTTLGGISNYDSGLEGATCTNYPQQGADVAYTVDLLDNTAYTFTLSGLDATFDASISLVGPGTASVCDANPIATCVGGADVGLEGDTETFQYTTPATGGAGAYYVVVDSYYPTTDARGEGNFTVGVTSP